MGALLNFISTLVSLWWLAIPIAAILIYLTWRNYQKATAIMSSAENTEYTLLSIEIPRTNDKKELAAEQLFASLHGILRDKSELRKNKGTQEYLSFEIAAIKKHIRFFVRVPKHLQNFVEGQIYAQYPTAQINIEDHDYAASDDAYHHPVVHTSELVLSDNEFLPIKTFQSFEVDPLAGITATLAKLEDDDEEVWIQVLARPIADSWHTMASSAASRMKAGGGTDLFGGAGKYVGSLLEALWKPPEQGGGDKKGPEMSERTKTRISEIETKSTKLGYQVKIRLAYLGSSEATARLRMQALVGTFKQFNSTNLNGFKQSKASFKREALAEYSARFFIDQGFILNIEELASVFHLPHTNVETPNIVWATTKTAEPPAKLPVVTGDDAIDSQISAFGVTNFRGINYQFGLSRIDRSRHVYVIGQTGAGKSGLLELLALSDVFHNQGYAIIDPHGDFAIDNMRFIPAHRLQDVVYFNPADTAHPLGFNPMEVPNPAMRNNISSEIIGVLKRMFGDSWGPRLEYILRYTILALLDHPNTTMLDITRMLTDKKFREKVLATCNDAVVLNFWRIEFASWNDKFAAEAVAPVLNKVGAFTANPIIRNIIGQPKSTFNIRQIMDEGKILIVNLSKGLIGEDNAAILGSFLVTKIQLAAMSRSDIPNIEDRRPFYLYVDEFQNFATDSFATILSEARKYALNLTVANQYISQMNETVRDAVFGNVGTMISFRVSADDAPILSKQFEPQFEANDLLQMQNRLFVVNMIINGDKAPAFSAKTLQLPPPQADLSSHIIENTRRIYGRERAEVEAEIRELSESSAAGQKAVFSAAQAKQWPVDAGAKKIQPREQRSPAPQTQSRPPESRPQSPRDPQPHRVSPPREDSLQSAPAVPREQGSGDDERPKRKRTRSRKKKSAPDEGPVRTASTPPSKPNPDFVDIPH